MFVCSASQAVSLTLVMSVSALARLVCQLRASVIACGHGTLLSDPKIVCQEAASSDIGALSGSTRVGSSISVKRKCGSRQHDAKQSATRMEPDISDDPHVLRIAHKFWSAMIVFP